MCVKALTLHMPEPLSTTSACTSSSSDMFVKGFGVFTKGVVSTCECSDQTPKISSQDLETSKLFHTRQNLKKKIYGYMTFSRSHSKKRCPVLVSPIGR